MRVCLARSEALFSCGMGILGNFRDCESEEDTHGYARGSKKDNFEEACQGLTSRGTGYVQVAFIPNSVCEEVEKRLDKRWKVVFASEKRTNKNSGNTFWFKIYDYTQKPEA